MTNPDKRQAACAVQAWAWAAGDVPLFQTLYQNDRVVHLILDHIARRQRNQNDKR